MNAPADLLDAATTAADCASWLLREDLTRLALLAYEMARLDCAPPGGQPFMVAGDAYCDRLTFRDVLLDNLALLIDRHGIDVGCWPEANGMDRLELVLADYRRALERQRAHLQDQP